MLFNLSTIDNISIYYYWICYMYIDLNWMSQDDGQISNTVYTVVELNDIALCINKSLMACKQQKTTKRYPI